MEGRARYSGMANPAVISGTGAPSTGEFRSQAADLAEDGISDQRRVDHFCPCRGADLGSGGRIAGEMGVQQVTAGGQLDGSLSQVPADRMRIDDIHLAQGAGRTMQDLSRAAQRDPRIKGRTRSPGGILSGRILRELPRRRHVA